MRLRTFLMIKRNDLRRMIRVSYPPVGICKREPVLTIFICPGSAHSVCVCSLHYLTRSRHLNSVCYLCRRYGFVGSNRWSFVFLYIKIHAPANNEKCNNRKYDRQQKTLFKIFHDFSLALVRTSKRAPKTRLRNNPQKRWVATGNPLPPKRFSRRGDIETLLLQSRHVCFTLSAQTLLSIP